MEPTTSNAPPPPPPPQMPTAPPRPALRRVTEGRWIAGVAAGVGRHLGIDPIIVRIVAVALVFFGGTGFAVYGLAWLLIPKDDETRSIAQQWTRDVDGRWRMAGIGAVILGGVLLAGAIGSGEIIVPLLLLAAGGWLLVRGDGDGGPDLAPPTSAHPPPTSADPSAPPSPAGPPVVADSTTLASPVGSDEANPLDPTSVTDQGLPTGSIPDAPPVPAEPKPSSFITPLVLALVLLIGGGGVLASQADLFDVSVAGVLALGLLVVGIGLLVSARWGRARGLIPLGLVLAAGVGIASIVDFPLWSGMGERIVVADEITDVDDPVRLGIGALELDLTGLDLDGETQQIETGVSLGELVIIVPRDVDVDFTGEVSAGQIRAFEGFGADDASSVDGVDRTMRTTRDGDDPTSGTLVIDAQVGFGEIRVEVDGRG